jgi:hypothetical protein
MGERLEAFGEILGRPNPGGLDSDLDEGARLSAMDG